MLLAGLCNFVAYLSLTRALQLTNLIYINALNATQVAMASVAGVVLFDEVPSRALAAGVALTICGLLLMPRHSRPRAGSAAHRDDALRSEEGVQNDRNRVSSFNSCSSSQLAREDAPASGCTSSAGSTAGRAACAEEG
jgi:Na+/H+ antiporter NhaC